MAKTIPLIRAAVLFPITRWLRENGHSVSDWLAMVGLDQFNEDARERPIPLLKVFDLTRRLATREGPDICARVVSPQSIEDLGVLGGLILGARTPREALTRTVQFLPGYSTHEIGILRPIPGGLRFQVGWSLLLDDELMHLTQQFTAALVVGLCLATNLDKAMPRKIKVRAHPRRGVDHLRQYFGAVLVAAEDAVLSIDLDDRVLDAPFQFDASGGFDLPPQDWAMPHGEGSFSASVRLVLDALDTHSPVRLDLVATLSGQSNRSFQRALTNEGTNFRSLLDESRRNRTLDAYSADCQSEALVAQDLGFSGQSALARAVRRWTGVSPKQLRNSGLPSDISKKP